MTSKVELRNVKYAAFASQETACFEATVVIDGKVEGRVSNDGHGGADRHSTQALQAKLEAWAKTLPPYTTKYHPEPHAHSAETAVGDLLDDFLLRRAMKRELARKVVFVRGEKLFTLTSPKKDVATAAVDFARWGADVTHVLNTMPEDEALAIYRRLGTK